MAELEMPRLPDNRSTQRLMNILHQLEEHLANAAAVKGKPAAASDGDDAPVGSQINGEIARLRSQNKQLRNRQRAVADRLDDLIVRMQSQLSATDNPQQEHAA